MEILASDRKESVGMSRESLTILSLMRVRTGLRKAL